MAMLSMVKPEWQVCDLSQNLGRMPVICPDQNFMCITPGAQKLFVKIIHFINCQVNSIRIAPPKGRVDTIGFELRTV